METDVQHVWQNHGPRLEVQQHAEPGHPAYRRITILRLTGHTSIAAALRHHARQPGRPLQTITQC